MCMEAATKDEVRDTDYFIIERLIKEGVLTSVDPERLCSGNEFIFLQCADEKDTNTRDLEYLKRAGLDIKKSPSIITCIQPLGGILWLSPKSPIYKGKNPKYIEMVLDHYHEQFRLAPELTGKRVRCFRGHYPCKAADGLGIGIVEGLAIFHHGMETIKQRSQDVVKPAAGYHIQWDDCRAMQTRHLQRRELYKLARDRAMIPHIFRDEQEFLRTQEFLRI